VEILKSSFRSKSSPEFLINSSLFSILSNLSLRNKDLGRNWKWFIEIPLAICKSHHNYLRHFIIFPIKAKKIVVVLMYFFEKGQIHHLNDTPDPHNYTIIIGEWEFKYTKAQLSLLSLAVLKHFPHNTAPFFLFQHFNSNLIHPFSIDDIISCFEELDSLFCTNTEVIISQDNVSIFKCIADILDNSSFWSQWLKVSSEQSLFFYLSSK
jgi:hypothetical protein